MSDPNQDFQPPPPPTIQPEPERRRPTMLMWVGIALVVIGIVVVVLGIPMIVGLITGGVGTGLSICALGLLFIGFSFMRLPAAGDVPPPARPAQRVVALTVFVLGPALFILGIAAVLLIIGLGPKPKLVAAAAGGLVLGPFAFVWGLLRSFDAKIFYEPTAFFRSLRAHPQWLAPILLVGILNGAYTTAFVHRLTPERIINFTVEKLQDSPIKPPPEALENMRTEGAETQRAVTQQIGNFLKAIVGGFFGVAFLAALCLLGVLAFGGRMHYWQTYSVMAFVTFPVTMIQKGISFIILYLKSPDDIHPLIGQESLVYDNLGLLFSSKDHPVLYVMAAAIGVLSFYRLWLTATGLREGGYKVSSSAAWGVAITLFVLFLLLGMAIAAIFPSFLG